MKKSPIFLICLAVAALLLSSCEKYEYEKHRRSLLIYMAGANSLSVNSESDLSDVEAGYVPEDGKKDDILMVFCHNRNQSPMLMRLWKDSSGEVHRKVIVDYGSSFKSTSAEGVERVLSDAAKAYPCVEYGLLLWSHATGWLPQGYYNNPTDGYSTSSADSFGVQDNCEDEVDLKDLARLMPVKYRYIIFDCCLMGGVEVAYELKDKCDYIVSSPTEILAEGMPYTVIAEPLFNKKLDTESALEQVCRSYMNLYKPNSSATISLVKCSALDGVAAACKSINAKYAAEREAVDRSKVQRYYRSNHWWFYDLQDYYAQFCPASELGPLQSALKQAVVYKDNTNTFLGIEIRNYSGLSTYIPKSTWVNLNDYYRTLAWNKAVNVIQ